MNYQIILASFKKNQTSYFCLNGRPFGPLPPTPLLRLLMARPKRFFSASLSTDGHTTLKVVGRYLYWFVTIFAKKYGYFSPKIGES